MRLKDLLCLLEERLTQHDNNRKEVQDQLRDVHSKGLEEVNLLDEKINEKIHNTFNATEERIFSLIDKINNDNRNESHNSLIEQIQKEISFEHKYEIEHSENTTFVESYSLNVIPVETEKKNEINDTCRGESSELIKKLLTERLDKENEAIHAAQDKLTEICTNRRKNIEELETKANTRLEELFAQEDARIQGVVNGVKEGMSSGNTDNSERLATEAKVALIKNQRYSLANEQNGKHSYELIVTNDYSMEYINFEERQPSNVTAKIDENGIFSLSFAFFSDDEMEFLKMFNLLLDVVVCVWRKDLGEEDEVSCAGKYDLEKPKVVIPVDRISPNANYCLKIKIVHRGSSTKWSENVEFTTPGFKDCCSWKKCPEDINDKMKYSVDENKPRIATGNNRAISYNCTIVGNTFLPPNKITSWNVKVLKSKDDNGHNIYIGIAPFGINQNDKDNYEKKWVVLLLS